MGKHSAPHEPGSGKRLVPENSEKPPFRPADEAAVPAHLIAVLVTYLVADLIAALIAASGKLTEAVQDDLQHENDESGAVAAPVSLSLRTAVLLTAPLNKLICRNEDEKPPPLSGKEPVPQPSLAPVPVSEGMNELKPAAEYRALYERRQV